MEVRRRVLASAPNHDDPIDARLGAPDFARPAKDLAHACPSAWQREHGEGLALRIAAGTVTLYTLAILYLHLTAPFYCSAKGTYLAAATPFFAVLAAAGFAELARARWVHAALTAALVCWVANVVATYWVV